MIRHRQRRQRESDQRKDARYETGAGGDAWLRRFPWNLLRLARAGDGRALGTLSVWRWYEHWFIWRHHVRPVRPGAIFCVSRERHRGAPVTLKDGTVVRTGDPIIEIHFDNPRVLRLLHEGVTLWQGVRLARGDLAALCDRVGRGEFGEVRAIHGVSLLAELGTRLGFEYRPLPHSWGVALQRYFMIGLLMLYHPAGRRRLDTLPRTTWPGEVWLGINDIGAARLREPSPHAATTLSAGEPTSSS